jgi:PhnB protein
MLAPGMSPVIPYLCVSDVSKSLLFYQRAFQFEIMEAVPGDLGTVVHGEMRYRGMVIMLGAESSSEDIKSPRHSGILSPMLLYIYVDDIDTFYEQAIGKGAVGVVQPEDAFWGDRYAQLSDLDGYIWSFGTYLQR